MSDKFVRNDHLGGEHCGRGVRWVLASGQRGDHVEVYGLKCRTDPGVRISISDYGLGTNTAAHSCICMNPESAIEFAEEIIRLARLVREPAQTGGSDA